MRTLSLLIIASAALFAAELTTCDGRTIAYDIIDCDPKRPKSCFVLKQGSTITTLKQSECDAKALPEALRAQLDDYAALQLAEGLILFDDEWIDRDGHLLKTDSRFTCPKKFRAIGNNRFTLKNSTDERVTIGIRPTGDAKDKRRGYELSVAADKERTIQMPDCEFILLFVQENADGSELMVSESDLQTVKNTALTLTFTGKETGNGMKTTPVGSIPVPENMRKKR